MKTVYESPFQKIEHDSFLKYLKVSWANTQLMTEENYKTEMIAQINTAVKYRPAGYVVDSSDFYFIISPTLQNWTTQLFPKLMTAGVKKVAFLVSETVFSQIASLQPEEDISSGFQVRYFDNFEEAKNWIIMNVKLF